MMQEQAAERLSDEEGEDGQTVCRLAAQYNQVITGAPLRHSRPETDMKSHCCQIHNNHKFHENHNSVVLVDNEVF